MQKKTTQTNRFRIISGQWRSRLIPFAQVPAIRPTGDRIRETLFNWIQNNIVGATCLDLYCGSGALAFEALSRGAKAVSALEIDREASHQLKENAALLNTDNFTLINQSSLNYLASNPESHCFDIVFLDPPFAENLLQQSLDLLIKHHWIKPGSIIYLESGNSLDSLTFPEHISLSKQKKAGQVHYGICTVGT